MIFTSSITHEFVQKANEEREEKKNPVNIYLYACLL
jgi:hypothetical protein